MKCAIIIWCLCPPWWRANMWPDWQDGFFRSGAVWGCKIYSKYSRFWKKSQELQGLNVKQASCVVFCWRALLNVVYSLKRTQSDMSGLLIHWSCNLGFLHWNKFKTPTWSLLILENSLENKTWRFIIQVRHAWMCEIPCIKESHSQMLLFWDP